MYRLVDRLVICEKLIYGINTSHNLNWTQNCEGMKYDLYVKGQITERGSACVSLGKDERHCKTSIRSHQSHVFFIVEHALLMLLQERIEK